MIIIVLYHSVLAWNDSWFNAVKIVYHCFNLGVLASWLGTFHVYTFACVSGYLFYYCKYEKNSISYTYFYSFIKNKFKRLIIPYYCIATLWVAPIKYLFYPITVETYFKSYILGEDAEQLWFLLMLFLVFLMAFLLSDLIKKSFIFGIVICMVFWFVGLVLTRGIANVFCFRTALQYLPFFFIGFWIRQYNIKFRLSTLILLLLNVVLFIFLRNIDPDSNIELLLYMFYELILHIFSVIFIWKVLQNISKSVYKKIKYTKLWMIFEKNSMGVYMFHMQIVYFTLYIFNGLLNPYLHAMANFIVSFFGSIVISSILRRFKVSRFMIGE